jgi:DnaA family protein
MRDPYGQMTCQLPLAIQLNDEATWDDFCWQGNALLQQQLELALQGNTYRQMYLWGASGSGKSHLLQACCQAIGAQQSAIYIPLKMCLELGPDIIEGIDDHMLISIDDIDVVAGHPAWEEALFHLYNRIRDRERSTLIISSTQSSMTSSIQLPDLRSRLNWGLVIQLHELADADKVSTLILHAKKRGFDLPRSVGQFLLNRCSRNMHDLHNLLNKLDKASLVAQRKITIPFVKEILDI